MLSLILFLLRIKDFRQVHFKRFIKEYRQYFGVDMKSISTVYLFNQCLMSDSCVPDSLLVSMCTRLVDFL